MLDCYNRAIDYLRISITDRCNLRCIYCMPEGVVVRKAASEILSFEEILRVVKICTTIGVSKIKVSGGEPLIRKGCCKLLESLIRLPKIQEVSLTTNGLLVKQYIKELKEAGLKRMNISIDTLDAQKFRYIAGCGELPDVLRGIDAAIENGFFVKLNVVMMKGVNDNEITEFAQFARKKKLIVRFIELMPVVDSRLLNRDFYLSCEVVKKRLKSLGSLKPIHAKSFGNGPAQYFEIENHSCVVGFISSISCKFCSSCNRIRLTSTGMLMPCLASSDGFNLKDPLRQNKEEDVLALLNKAILAKPPEHDFVLSFPRQYLMSQIGG
ncbi:MAG: cyclic pyranopterin phosphate synthase MoaA [Omnitrophica WOR_2 bacterium RBG_13_44_8b]|nr:MAG: cyclic pyranopterin phosphate synthase MoaA [Omnitrophica WOR_2 bacterium RBG_13_44_8b]